MLYTSQCFQSNKSYILQFENIHRANLSLVVQRLVAYFRISGNLWELIPP